MPFFGKYKTKSSEEPSKHDVILAFCTITTMLSVIQSSVPGVADSELNLSPELWHELRVLDTLAALIVRHHEIVAVIAKPADTSAVIQVLCSVVNLDEISPKLIISHPSDFLMN